ncbi:A-agglutinin anchorage subunit isoform X2 [Oryzias latipes]|uniref:A-agglutinin anchorage subunit isoform X2 n=1 Tax=Oryzias latipes TaxID=8090 RepID=UPI000CE21C9F|nr:A-agglutinin anchorage subunit isoform X2 [Oryzias latipes]
MEVSWLVLLVSAAVFAAIFLLLVTCVDCTNQGPLGERKPRLPAATCAHIIQRTPSEEDVPPSGFIVIHPRTGSTLPAVDVNPAHPSSIALSPYPSSAHPGYRRPTTPTETESNPSYENSGMPSAQRESDGEDTGYITVLPENDPGKSRASTPSSDPDCSSSSSTDDLHEYVNVESQGSSNYLNVPSPSNARSTPEPSCPSVSDDDDDNNYVNQLPINDG